MSKGNEFYELRVRKQKASRYADVCIGSACTTDVAARVLAHTSIPVQGTSAVCTRTVSHQTSDYRDRKASMHVVSS